MNVNISSDFELLIFVWFQRGFNPQLLKTPSIPPTNSKFLSYYFSFFFLYSSILCCCRIAFYNFFLLFPEVTDLVRQRIRKSCLDNALFLKLTTFQRKMNTKRTKKSFMKNVNKQLTCFQNLQCASAIFFRKM